ncbi:hypothetical protein SKUN_00489 [Spiroplasma kunkelii CR2-3x]|uniref:DUF262 domain-containing protein n=1 Tax=Spiroplasma kunkelii CR2-3x TaxID=273035 RepID=A0A0K2JFN0_SPIKU|nr:hypothetical protein [Spiroplasma kunkelii]ALA97390.1 hypothetical protein SKUN_00489 [Spiroplasma kunkelii CR2-3x]
MSIKSSEIKKIGSLIFGDTYWIPDSQREYSWDKEELIDLWIDLEEMINCRNHTHFVFLVFTVLESKFF